MEIHELVIEMKLLERRLTLYEEKYGVLSEDFYAEIMSGKLAEYDAYDETRADFSRWKGIYETLQRRKAAYRKQFEGRDLAKVMRFQRPNLHAIIQEIEDIDKVSRTAFIITPE